MRDRQSMRLQGYDYSAPGMYFITINTQYRAHLFGRVIDAQMNLSPAGVMAAAIWRALPEHYPTVQIDTFIVMPDHMHGILVLTADGGSDAKVTVSDIVCGFKSMTTIAYGHGVRLHGWPRFRRRVWQRNYYDRIIRTHRALVDIRNYIDANPAKWSARERRWDRVVRS